MSDYRTYVTQTGFGLERDAKFNNSYVDLAVLVIGDGVLADSASPAERTDLIHQVREYGLTIEKDEKDPNVWIARAEIPASDGGFFIKEAGIKTGDGYLYAFARQAGDYKPLLSEGQGKSYTIRLKFIPGNADSIQIKIDPSVQFATPTDLENLKKEHSEDKDPHPQYETDEGATAKANNALNSAKSYTNSKATETLNAAKSDASTKSNSALSSAKSYTDSKSTEALNAAKADAATKSNNALSSAKSYTDNKSTEALNAAKADATSKSNSALSSAKSYTDSKATETLNSAKADATTKSNNALSSAKSYTDSKSTEALNAAKADASTKSNNALSSAKNYTDSEVAKKLIAAKNYAESLVVAGRSFSVSGDANNIVLKTKKGGSALNELQDYDEFTFVVAETNTSTVTIKIDNVAALNLEGIVADSQIFKTALLTVRYINGAFYIADQINAKTGNSVLDIAKLYTDTIDILRPGEYALDGTAISSVDHPIACAIVKASSNYISQAIKDADPITYSGYYGFVEELDGSTTVTLPIVGGEFIRMYDDGRGVDAGRGFGGFQQDAIRTITGTFTGAKAGSGGGAFYRNGASGQNSNGGPTQYYNISFDASRVVPTADQNRPRSIAYYGKTRL
ncbi:phage tail protein [Marinomonas sp. FW-1]|uniref:phage tail-collar fiber domain-containing protein n=1 Tax=Marinomonas sp. FW-1 TaxID=2071621 RepID=UPI0010C08721|nr:phage tail protein [Marinomonas sp. FW-1]